MKLLPLGLLALVREEPHLGALHVVVLCSVAHAKPGDHDLVVQVDVEVAIDLGVPILSRAESLLFDATLI